ncbi:MAG: hypothetical protein ILO42_05675 [Clostridia bacterium]|nr:hypothetical protein [Clostridia bacterium]
MSIKRMLPIVLACFLVLPVFFGCANGTGDGTTAPTTTAQVIPDESEEASETESDYVADGLPETMNLDRTVTILYDTKTSAQEFFADDTNGEAINDAIYARNAAIEARLNVTLKYVGEVGNHDNQNVYLNKAKADTDGEFDIYGAYSRTCAYCAMNGLCYNLVNTQYFDIEKPWWPEALTKECLIKNKLYFCSGDISTNLLWYMSALFINLDMWNDANPGYSLYDTVEKKEWVLDKFAEICKSFYGDENGSQTVDIGDRFGIVGYDACFDAFLNSSGVISIIKDADGNLALNPDFLGERTVDIVNRMALITRDASCHHSDVSKDEKAIFYDGRSLFIVDGPQIISSGGADLPFVLGMIPLPMFNSEQENYITNIRYPFNIYAISARCEDPDAASAVLEALASSSYNNITPIIFEVVMKMRYSADSTASKMYDILRDTVCFDLGRVLNYSVGNFYPNFRKCCFNNTNWSTAAKSIKGSAERFLNTIMKDVYNK